MAELIPVKQIKCYEEITEYLRTQESKGLISDLRCWWHGVSTVRNEREVGQMIYETHWGVHKNVVLQEAFRLACDRGGWVTAMVSIERENGGWLDYADRGLLKEDTYVKANISICFPRGD